MRGCSLLLGFMLFASASTGCLDAIEGLGNEETNSAHSSFNFSASNDIVTGTTSWQGTWNVHMDHFQGTFPQAVSSPTPVVALKTSGPLSAPHARLSLLDSDGVERVNQPLTDANLPLETTARDHAGEETWTLRVVTTEPVTGNLTVEIGDPDTVGVHPQEPIVYEETLVQSSEDQTWTWASDGQAQLLVDADSVTGSAVVKVQNATGATITEIPVASPGQTNRSSVLYNEPGAWSLTLQPESYSGTIELTLREW